MMSQYASGPLATKRACTSSPSANAARAFDPPAGGGVAVSVDHCHTLRRRSAATAISSEASAAARAAGRERRWRREPLTDPRRDAQGAPIDAFEVGGQVLGDPGGPGWIDRQQATHHTLSNARCVRGAWRSAAAHSACASASSLPGLSQPASSRPQSIAAKRSASGYLTLLPSRGPRAAAPPRRAASASCVSSVRRRCCSNRFRKDSAARSAICRLVMAGLPGPLPTACKRTLQPG
jgi:hypothetical protein